MDNDVSLIDMIRDLQEAGIGDQRRLSYIMNRIENNRSIYNSDEQYVREKFKQLREEIVQKSNDFDRMNPLSKDTVQLPEPELPAPHKVSKAWYLLPIFLGMLGGLIVFAALRKRNKSMAYKNLIVGIGLTMLLVIPMGVLVALEMGEDNVFESEPDTSYTNAEIKKMAVTIPHDFLMKNPEMHEGEIVYYMGKIVQTQQSLFGKYMLRVEVSLDELFESNVIWINYTPSSDEEEAWLDAIGDDPSAIFRGEQETIEVWGISKGIKEYDTILGGTKTIPEIDALFIERHSQDKQATSSTGSELQTILTEQPHASHTISFSNIPAYVDAPTVKRAVIDAVREWDMVNPNVGFTIVESDADVNINWVRYMPGSALGLHSASVTDDGVRERHSITVRLGIDDCHSKYLPFTHNTLQYIIAHETGHYLGLRHIDDKSHLMYSGEFFNVDSSKIYDDLNLGIPHLKKPDNVTEDGLAIQTQIDKLDSELKQISLQRQELKNIGNDLDDNTNSYNNLIQKIQELEKQLVCASLT